MSIRLFFLITIFFLTRFQGWPDSGPPMALKLGFLLRIHSCRLKELSSFPKPGVGQRIALRAPQTARNFAFVHSEVSGGEGRAGPEVGVWWGGSY